MSNSGILMEKVVDVEEWGCKEEKDIREGQKLKYPHGRK